MLLLIAGVLSISHNPAATVTHYTAPTSKAEVRYLEAAYTQSSLQVKRKKPLSKMTTQQKINYLKRQIHKDHCVLRFWKNHTATAVTHTQVHWAQTSLRIAGKNLHKYEVPHHTTSYTYAGFPQHHQLWVCIHNNEGPWNDTSSPYFGGLQMHENWYGLGNAGYYSESVQEWTAEKAYKNSGYAYSFLYGQWFEWDNADYCAKYG